MRNFKIIVAFFVIGFSINLNSQVRIGGSIDINIDFPSPKVVIIKEESKPVYKVKKVKKHKGPHPKKRACEVYEYNLGTISNQNNRYGSVDLIVVDVSFENIGRGLERITYFTNTKEILEIIIHTNNPNDYNYHYNINPHCNSNRIVSAALNGHEMPLRDGSISLQSRQHLYTVVNLHSFHQGNFNGVVHS